MRSRYLAEFRQKLSAEDAYNEYRKAQRRMDTGKRIADGGELPKPQNTPKCQGNRGFDAGYYATVFIDVQDGRTGQTRRLRIADMPIGDARNASEIIAEAVRRINQSKRGETRLSETDPKARRGESALPETAKIGSVCYQS